MRKASMFYQLTTFHWLCKPHFHSEMLKKLAKNGVCCDSTHGTNGCDFPLTTIHVIDEFGEGVPIAWCISSHEDFSISMIVFFSEIKKCRTVRSAFFNE